MKMVNCPNGHPNEPGNSYCSTCLAPLNPEQPGQTAAKGSSSTTSRKVTATPERPPPLPRPKRRPEPGPSAPTDLPAAAEAEQVKAAPAKRSSLWVLLLALLALAGLAGCALLAVWLVIPTSRETEDTVQSQVIIQPTATDEETTIETPEATVPVIVLETTEPEPSPFPTITALPASPTPIIGVIVMPSEEAISATPGSTDSIEGSLNLLQNGDFNDDWANGWTSETVTTNGTQVIEELPASFDVPGQVLSMGRTGGGNTVLSQRVIVGNQATDAVFRAKVRQSGTVSGANGPEGRSALILVYESENGTPQGASVWLDGAAGETGLWASSPLAELGPNLMARYAEGNDWYDIEVPLKSEFMEALPDIDPGEISQITVMLLLIGSDDCSPAGCLSTLEVADLQLTVPAP